MTGILRSRPATQSAQGKQYADNLHHRIAIDYIDESEVLSPADDTRHIDKTKFAVPFVCGARDLEEALRRIGDGAPTAVRYRNITALTWHPELAD